MEQQDAPRREGAMKRRRHDEDAAEGSGDEDAPEQQRHERKQRQQADDEPIPEVEVARVKEEEAAAEAGDDAAPEEKQQPPKPLSKRAVRYRIQAERLPTSEMYEKSYMHRDNVSHIVVTRTDFLVTASLDGFVKFWKKTQGGIEFIKAFKAHLAPLVGMCASQDGSLLASVSLDKTAKIFDVINFDMIRLLKLPFAPLACEWLNAKNAPGRLAISDSEAGTVHIYKTQGASSEPYASVTHHQHPVQHIKLNTALNIVLTADSIGIIEYWDADTLEFPEAKSNNALQFKFKTETSLYEFLRRQTCPDSLAVSSDGRYFATMGRDRFVRVFVFATGKLLREYDERMDVYEKAQTTENEVYKMDTIDFGRRMAVERELEKAARASPVPPSNVVFDDSATFILYPTLLGIKVINFHTNQLVRVLGKVENTERFLGLALYQGIPRGQGISAVGEAGFSLIGASTSSIERKSEDPAVFCAAFKKSRFFWFSKRDPKEPDPNNIAATGRDVFNEKPLKELQKLLAIPSKAALGSVVVMHTTMGDITLELYPDECPKTVENFTTHARNGYYNSTLWHRVIKEFMIQGGDPEGNGTGGESVWGGEFPDEISPKFKHDRAGVLSMANAGPNTNGSQFFISCVPCPWLDGKHTIFGIVTKGLDVVHAIEKVKVDRSSKPLLPVKIINIDVAKEK